MKAMCSSLEAFSGAFFTDTELVLFFSLSKSDEVLRTFKLETLLDLPPVLCALLGRKSAKCPQVTICDGRTLELVEP